MVILVIGSHGNIGRLLVPMLAERHEVRAMVRDPAQAQRLRNLGAQPVVADLERPIDEAVRGCEAIVFTAGSGGHTGGDKTLVVDLWGAMRAIDTAKRHNVRRFVMVSAIGAADPDQGSDRIRHYLVAKRVADDHLARSGLDDHVIIRPGRLTDEPGTGQVTAGTDIGYGPIPRADVAATIAAVLDRPPLSTRTFCVLAGETPINDALDRL